MKKLFILFTIVFATSLSATAQGDDYKKNEFYIGYSHERFDDGARRALNGGEFAYTRNVSRYIGVKGDVSAVTGSNTFNSTFQNPGGPGNVSIKQDTNVLNVNAGLQFKDNGSESRLKPFAHVLGGIAYKKDTFSSTCTGNCTGIAFPDGSFSNTGASAILGGGLDIRLSDKIQLRAIQVDYNPITTGGGGSNNFRFGAGIVF